jgi:RES domain-containing protein
MWAPFDGEGAYRYGGRWSSPGARHGYTSEHQSLAMLEYFIHLDVDAPPGDLVLAVSEVPDDLARERVETSSLPAHWRESAAPSDIKNRRIWQFRQRTSVSPEEILLWGY